MPCKNSQKKEKFINFVHILAEEDRNTPPKMRNDVEIIQINISGEDKPGMTSSLTEILARYDAFILD